MRHRDGVVERDLVVLVEAEQRLVERDHAVVLALLHRVPDQVCLVGIRDVLADRAGHDQHLYRRDEPALHRRDEPQRNYALERGGQHQADLLLLVRREEVDDAADRLGRVDGVQRRQHEVADLSRSQRCRDSLVVAHLTDQDDVWVLSHHVAQRFFVAVGVDSDLALVDDALLVLVQHLDRVFDRDDVALSRGVDVVDHRSQRRRLA